MTLTLTLLLTLTLNLTLALTLQPTLTHTRHVTDQLHAVTVQLYEASFFEKCWDGDLMQLVSDQALQAGEGGEEGGETVREVRL